jgi:glycosyltransferase involved in cell wall biosynthesis
VIIVNDGTDTHLSQEFFNRYSFPIEYHLNEHKGVSATRNACLDYATADYVMFCDADDMFYNACGMYIIFREIENGGFDSLVSAFIEESRHPETKEPLYILSTTFKTKQEELQVFDELKEKDEIIRVKVVRVTSAGADLKYKNLDAKIFLPIKNSELSEGALKALKGETIDVIVLNVNYERLSVVVSQTIAERKKHRLAKEAAYAALSVRLRALLCSCRLWGALLGVQSRQVAQGQSHAGASRGGGL